jgi:tetratricopeptide (TPR) repeat protein
MKMCLLIIALFLNTHSFCQVKNWKKGNAEMLRLEQNGEFKKAIDVGEQTLALTLKKYGPLSEQVSSVSENLGANYVYFEDYEKGKSLLLKAMQIELKFQNEKNLASIYNNLAICYARQKRYDSANCFYGKSFQIYKSIYPDDDSYVMTVKSNLAHCYLMTTQTEKAIHLYNELAKVYLAKSSTGITYTLKCLGDCYMQLGMVKESEEYYAVAKLYFEKFSLQGKSEYAILLIDYGRCEMQLNKVDEGKKMIKEGVRLAKIVIQNDGVLKGELREMVSQHDSIATE